MGDFVLKGHICFSLSAKELAVYENAYLVCLGGSCAGVFDSLPEEYTGLPLTDFGDRLIIPGMTDLHLHAPQYAFRGMCMDMELMDWLNEYTFPEEEKYADLDYAQRAYSIFAHALRRGATTRACVFATRHRAGTVKLMEIMEKSGLVTMVGKVNMDREATPGLQEHDADESARETLAWLEDIKGKFHRTKPILTPRFIPSCSDELMGRLQEIQTKYDLPVQSHLSESPGEIDFVRALRPQNDFYGQAYDDYGLFGKNKTTGEPVKTVMAHCVWSGEDEVALMAENGVFVAHCPASNMNLSSGIAPIRRYLDMGIRVGLGTDVAGGHSDSLFRAISDAVQVSKMYWRLVDGSMKPVSFPEAFYMATMGGGAFFGKVGSFMPGCELDALVLDDDSLPTPRELTVLQRLERAVYLSLDDKGIFAKFVQGEKLF